MFAADIAPLPPAPRWHRWAVAGLRFLTTALFTAPAGKWLDRDLYVVVYGLDGMSLAHGANPKQVGVMLIDRKDIDGKEFIRERVDLAKAKPSFWQDYKFQNPATKKVEPKTMYCERLNETAVCAGVYK